MKQSYAACRDITRRANSSFSLAFLLVSPPKRRAMEALYAFSRLTDDITDESGEVAAKSEKLTQWRTAFKGCLAGRFTHPIHAALHDTVGRYEIPPRYLLELIDGVAIDLEPVRFETFDQLRVYCYGVASSVGLACVRIWGLKRGVSFVRVESPAIAAGIALQLTNILRDLDEDAKRGRVYIPSEENSSGLSLQVDRAREYYRQAEALDAMLSREGRAIFRAMFGTYRALLDEIERGSILRARVPTWRKGLIFLSAWPIRLGLS